MHLKLRAANLCPVCTKYNGVHCMKAVASSYAQMVIDITPRVSMYGQKSDLIRLSEHEQLV